MNRANDTTNDNIDNARDRRADSVRFGEMDGESGGLAGNQANKGMLTEAVSVKLSKNLIDATTNGDKGDKPGKDSSDEPAALFRA